MFLCLILPPSPVGTRKHGGARPFLKIFEGEGCNFAEATCMLLGTIWKRRRRAGRVALLRPPPTPIQKEQLKHLCQHEPTLGLHGSQPYRPTQLSTLPLRVQTPALTSIRPEREFPWSPGERPASRGRPCLRSSRFLSGSVRGRAFPL